MCTSSQIIKGARGIKLAGYYDLIKVGMSCKTLSVLSAYFGDALDRLSVAWFVRMAWGKTL